MATRKAPKPGSREWENAWHSAWERNNPGQTMRPQAAWPNPGTYDPSFDINAENARLGHFRYGQDFARDWGELGAGATGGRMGADLQTALSRAGTARGWGNEDLDLQRDDIRRDAGRSLYDLRLGRSRATEDYRFNLAQLDRNYQRLGNNQAQAMRAAGVAGGGAAAQAARKRGLNRAWDQRPIEDSYRRYIADNSMSERRLGEDQQLALQGVERERGRFNTRSQWGVDDLNTQYTRGREDAITDYGRTNTDLQNYLTGQGRLAYYSSSQIQPAGIGILDLLRPRRSSH